MGEEINWVLSELGLSAKEVKVYLYAAKSGPQKAIELSKNLKMHKVEVYRFLKNLENKGLMESTLERPTRFTANPFEQVLDSLISEKRKTTAALQEKKKTILNQWKSMKVEKTPGITERFVILSGRKNVYSRMLNLIQRTQREILGITTNAGLIMGDQNGFLSQGITETAERSRDVQVYARLLTQLTKENLEIAKNFVQKLQRHHISIEIGQVDLNAKFAPRLLIRDGDEAVVFLTPRNMSIAKQEDTGVWTNSKAFVSALQALFEEMWKDSKPLSERIKELEKQQ